MYGIQPELNPCGLRVYGIEPEVNPCGLRVYGIHPDVNPRTPLIVTGFVRNSILCKTNKSVPQVQSKVYILSRYFVINEFNAL